jgi:hypothetical protein
VAPQSSSNNAKITVEMKREEVAQLLERIKTHCKEQPMDCDILDIFYSDID